MDELKNRTNSQYNNVIPFQRKNRRYLKPVRKAEITPFLRAPQKKENLNQCNDKLKLALETASLIAHNIKSPLMALELLATHKNLNIELKKTIREALNSAYEKINEINLLDNAEKMTSSSFELQKIDLNQLVKDCFANSTHLYQQDHNIKFKLNCKDSKLFSLICPEYFKSAFFNLIKNSYESIEEKGQVEVTVVSDIKNISITFTDNGKGIPAHLIPYLGLKRVSFGKKNGTGLGLYQVKKMIEQCGGQLDMSSSTQNGTRITLIIPKYEIAEPVAI